MFHKNWRASPNEDMIVVVPNRTNNPYHKKREFSRLVWQTTEHGIVLPIQEFDNDPLGHVHMHSS